MNPFAQNKSLDALDSLSFDEQPTHVGPAPTKTPEKTAETKAPAPLSFSLPPLQPNPEPLVLDDEPLEIDDGGMLDLPEARTVDNPETSSFEESTRVDFRAPKSLEDEPMDLPTQAPPPPKLAPPSVSDTLFDKAPPEFDLPAPLDADGDLPAPLGMDDDLPPPLEADAEEEVLPPEPIDLAQMRQERRAQAQLAPPEALLRDDDDTRAAVPKSASKKVPLIAGLAVVAIGAGLVAFQLTTGQWPWESHQTAPASQPTTAQAAPTVAPAPDFAALDGGDMETLDRALASLDERDKALLARNETVPATDRALRAKILWHGAVFNGSHAYASQLAQQAASQPAPAQPSPDDERAQAAGAFLTRDTKTFTTLENRMLARDKGDVEALLLQGFAKLRAGDADAATPSFEGVLASRPKSIDALLGLARVAEQSEDADAASKWVKQAAAVDSDNQRPVLEGALASKDQKGLLALDQDREALGDGEAARLDFELALTAAKAARLPDAAARLAAAYQEGATPEHARRFAWLAIYQNNLDVAAKALDDTAKLDESGAYAETVFLGRAQIALRRGQPEAIRALEAAAAKAGVEKRSLWLAEGWSLEKEGKAPAAGKAYFAALKADKTFSYAALGLERVASAKLKPKVRAARLTALAKKFPDARTYAALGFALLDDGDAAGAAERFEAALKLDPWSIDLPAVVAKYLDALNRSGRKDDAARITAVAQKVDPKDTAAAVKAVRLQLAAGETAAADVLVSKALEANPNDTNLILAQADVLIRENQREKAREVLQKVLKANETLPEAHAAMARSYFPGDPDTAKIHIRRAIELAPQNASYQMLLGQAYSAKEKWEEAKDAFTRVTELEPKNSDAHVALGKAYFELDRKREGVKELAVALQIAPERSELYAQVGAVYDEIGDRAKAVQTMTAGLKRNPNSFELLTQLGKINQEQGNRAGALKLYLAALKVRPNEPSVHYQLGYLYKDTNQIPAARREFETYLRLNPRADDAKDIEAEIADLK